jgi:hypothetical protein
MLKYTRKAFENMLGLPDGAELPAHLMKTYNRMLYVKKRATVNPVTHSLEFLVQVYEMAMLTDPAMTLVEHQDRLDWCSTKEEADAPDVGPVTALPEEEETNDELLEV